MNEVVSVLGAGAMGIALALVLDRAGNRVSVCGTEFDGSILEAIERDRIHPVLRQPVPSSILLVGPEDWNEPLVEAGIVAVAVTSRGLRETVKSISGYLSEEAVWAIATKGWDPQTSQPVSEVVSGVDPDHPLVIVVGPSLAGELAAGTPTGLVCASTNREASRRVADALRSSTVRTFTSDDVAGVEVGAAVKNVLAIAIGMCDGIAEVSSRPMSNTKAALFSRGLVEMGRLAVALGGKQETVLGLAGAGDLFVTVLGGRNGRFGRLVGTGLAPGRAFEEMNTTVEGYENAAAALVLAKRLDLHLPIVEMVYSVLYEDKPADEAIDAVAVGPVEPEL